MAKILSSFNDLFPMGDFLGIEYGCIKSDDDLFDGSNYLRSIQDDIQDMEKQPETIEPLFNSLLDTYCPEGKIEIRNGDCMWSGSAHTGNISAASSLNDSMMATSVPLAVVSGNTQNIMNNTKQQSQPTVVVANNSKLREQHKQQQYIEVKAEIKLEPNSDDYEQQLQQHSIPNNNNSRTLSLQQHQREQHIPPGGSLLRKSNAPQRKTLQQQQKSLQMTKMIASDLEHEHELVTRTTASATVASTHNPRPDTPPSLDDDATEFKHNVDLRACVMGSNNISLTADPDNFINRVSQELQDTSKNVINLNPLPADSDLADLFEIIGKDNSSATLTQVSSLSSTQRSSDFDSDFETESECRSPASSQDSHISSGIGSISSGHHHQQPYLHSDHSYTRCKDGPNLDTPSDSDEEIDVVSVSDKKLPTNPSDKDRHALQTKVASKFSSLEAGIVKNANGLRTIPPRRRVSDFYELPYTPASNSPVKSIANTRYPSPASTPFQQQQQQHTVCKYLPHDGNTSNGTPLNIISDKSRKRIVINGVEHALPPSKKYRGKKSKHYGSSFTSGSSSPLSSNSSVSSLSNAVSASKRQFVLDEAADTIEKRNLHNDMERQRRIGLKNLFESLKKQIPSIKDKERAPKVNILREAAKLCEALTLEDQLLSDQKAMLREQQRKRQELLARLRAEAAQRSD